MLEFQNALYTENLHASYTEKKEKLMSENDVTQEYVATPVDGKKKSDRGCYSAFAITGFVCGILGLITSLLGFTFLIPVLGIIFGSLGEKSYAQGDKGRSGKIMGIIGTAISVVFMIVYIIMMIVAAVKGIQKGGSALMDYIQNNNW